MWCSLLSLCFFHSCAHVSFFSHSRVRRMKGESIVSNRRTAIVFVPTRGTSMFLGAGRLISLDGLTSSHVAMGGEEASRFFSEARVWYWDGLHVEVSPCVLQGGPSPTIPLVGRGPSEPAWGCPRLSLALPSLLSSSSIGDPPLSDWRCDRAENEGAGIVGPTARNERHRPILRSDPCRTWIGPSAPPWEAFAPPRRPISRGPSWSPEPGLSMFVRDLST